METDQQFRELRDHQKRFTALLDQVRYLDWHFIVGLKDSTFYLQVAFVATDIVDGSLKRQTGRKWQLSIHMTDTEVIRTAHSAIQQAVLHEMNENFRYKGRRIAGPHIDVEALWNIANQLDVRARNEVSARELETAHGFELNRIGELFGVERDGCLEEDEVYRKRIIHTIVKGAYSG